MWEKYWENTNGDLPETIADTLLQCQKKQLKQTFPLISHCLRLLGTAPVSTCECERNISAMRILKDYKGTTTSQECFSSLAVLYVHRDFEIDFDLIIGQFATMHPRRMQFINILCDDE